MNLSKKILILVLTMLIIISPCINIVSTAEAAHPSPWYPLVNHSYKTSKKLKRSGKAILVAGILSVLPGGGKFTVKILAHATAGILLNNFFVNSDEADVYFSTNYYYRILSDGKVDCSGNRIGDYEIKKVITSYSDVGLTEVLASEEFVEKSSVVDPWF